MPSTKVAFSMSPLLIFHITTASIALSGGVAAMSMRKGSTGHLTGGTIFVIGMICMTVSAISLGILMAQTLNALVVRSPATSWQAAGLPAAVTDFRTCES